MMKERVSVLTVPVDCINMDDALAASELSLLQSDDSIVIAAVNPEKVIASLQDPTLAAALIQSDILIPDGIGVVLAARLLHQRPISRVAGVDLMLQLCGVAAKLQKSIYILGGAPGVASLAAARLKAAIPGLIVAGARDGYFRDDEATAIIEEVNSSGADLLFIGLGSPKQEIWIAEHRKNLRVKICQCVGGSIDVMAGRVKRAPLAFQKLKLEWFYRLCSEPGRIRRQKRLPLFVMALAKELALMTFQKRSAL